MIQKIKDILNDLNVDLEDLDINYFLKVYPNLIKCLEIQLDDNNWDHDEYMRGMANGMILVMSNILNKDPNFLETEDMVLNKIKKSEPMVSLGKC